MKDEILHRVLTDQYLYNTFIRAIGIVECLTPVQKMVYKKAVDITKSSEKVLTVDEANLLFGYSVKTTDLTADFLFEYVLSEVRKEKLKFWILGVAEDIEYDKVDYDKVYAQLTTLRDKLSVHTPKGVLAGSKFEDILAFESARAHVDTVKSGIKGLDAILKGGFHKGELAFVIAPPGRGKSTMLLNLAYSFLLQKRNILILSNELREQAILSRLYRRITKRVREDFTLGEKANIEAALGQYFKYAKGQAIVHYTPAHTFGVSDIRSWVAAWEKQFGEKVDIVLIDYFDRIKKPVSRDEYRLQLRSLTEDLRDLAVDQDLLIITATQTNRFALDAPLVTQQHVSEAFGKIEATDIAMSISQNEQERGQKRARITILKNREFGGEGTVIDVKVMWDLLSITDYVEEE